MATAGSPGSGRPLEPHRRALPVPGRAAPRLLPRGHAFSQATGQPRVEIFAESAAEFFLKEVDAQLSFRLEGPGTAEGLVLHQRGRDIAAKRLE